jgi:hypothetical protein
MVVRNQTRQAAFLLLALGGTGKAAVRPVRRLYDADGRPFPLVVVSVDTDPDPAPGADHEVALALDGQKARAVVANAEVFGPTAAAIVRAFRPMLDPENVLKGSRTTRALTQLAVLFYREALLERLRRAVLDLYHQGGFDHVIPVLMSSGGGGAGSALQVLLPQALCDPWFSARLTEGLPAGVVQTPVQFVVEPFALALRNQAAHANKILANAFAFRLESAVLELQGAVKYCFHLGLASDGGAVLDTPEEIARVLGTSVYQFLYHWPQVKARLVDTVDTHALTARYGGQDVWEVVRAMFRVPAPPPRTAASHRSLSPEPSVNGADHAPPP